MLAYLYWRTKPTAPLQMNHRVREVGSPRFVRDSVGNAPIWTTEYLTIGRSIVKWRPGKPGRRAKSVPVRFARPLDLGVVTSDRDGVGLHTALLCLRLVRSNGSAANRATAGGGSQRFQDPGRDAERSFNISTLLWKIGAPYGPLVTGWMRVGPRAGRCRGPAMWPRDRTADRRQLG